MKNSPLKTSEVEWELTVDGGEYDSIRHIEQTNDDGYICCGLTEESDMFYVQVLKLTSAGDIDWHIVNYDLNSSFVTGPNSWVFGMYVIQTEDGGYLVVGWAMIYVEIEEIGIWIPTGYLWKLDSAGATEWLEYYYDEAELAINFIYSVYELDDGYIFSGLKIFHDEFGEVIDVDGFLMETDSNGVVNWEEVYDAGGDNDNICSIYPTSDGYLLSGCTNAVDTEGSFWMLKTDKTGGVIWNSILDGPLFEYSYVRNCYETSDGGGMMIGNTMSYGAGSVDVWVVKTDAFGNMSWYRTYGGRNQDQTWGMGKSITDDGYLLAICKNLSYYGGTKEDIWIVKINEDGFTQWTYLIEDAGTQIPTCVRQTSDYGYIVSGRTATMGTTTSDGIVVKISPLDFQRPEKPDKPSGKRKVKTGEVYSYQTSATDPNGDDIWYQWDWGDDNLSEWLGPYKSGETCEATYAWAEAGEYPVKVMARDMTLGESDWSDTLSVNVPRTRAGSNTFLLHLFERFPNLLPLCRYLLGFE
jgi:hypothetical protein